MRMHRLWWMLATLASLYVLVRIVGLFLEPEMHDFRTYYYAAKVAAAGASPYDQKALLEASGGIVRFGYMYPPHVLPLFQPLTLLEPDSAARVFLLLKVLALAGLMSIWARILPAAKRWQGMALIVLFVAVGFHEAAMVDLAVGNVSIFEQLLLWSGFLAFTKGRYKVFAAMTLAASLIKIYPIAFLGLLLLVPGRRGWPALAGGIAGFVVVHGLSLLRQRALYQEFLGLTYGMAERGSINPCTLAAVRDVVPGPMATLVFGLVVILLLGLFLHRVHRTRETFQPLNLVFGAVLLLTLAAPRMKDYSYVLLFLPTVLAVLVFARKQKPLAWVLVVLALVGGLAYQSLLVALLLYVWWLREVPSRLPGLHSDVDGV